LERIIWKRKEGVSGILEKKKIQVQGLGRGRDLQKCWNLEEWLKEMILGGKRNLEGREKGVGKKIERIQATKKKGLIAREEKRKGAEANRREIVDKKPIGPLGR